MQRVFFIAVCLWASLFLFSAAEAEQQDPLQLVQQTTTEIFDAVENKRAQIDKDSNLLYELTNKIIVPHFDFVSISKWALGKNWRKASKEQKLRFIRAFRQLMVRVYGIALLEYNGNKIKYLPVRGDLGNGDVTVRTHFLQKGKPPVTINYSLHLKRDAWKVYDVSVEGVSIVATYRTSFASEVRQSGLDALIERIEEKNKKGSS